MRIAIIGLGKIARKAYLPLLTARNDIELLFCSRNPGTLEELTKLYRVTHAVDTLDDLFALGLDAAFVHTSTESHPEIAGKLLQNGIHVYVDKPLAYSFEESQKLVELAQRSGRILMVGFNRRFAPMYNALKSQAPRQLILLQKNRTFLPDYARRFVFDDFIHVADTLLYLAPGKLSQERVSGFHKGGQIHQLMLHLWGEGFSASGVMNRDSGIAEETLEVMTPGNKWVVRNLNSTIHYESGQERRYSFDDWDSVLYRRGFPQMIDHFLDCVRHNRTPLHSAKEALATHALCERMVSELERQQATA